MHSSSGGQHTAGLPQRVPPLKAHEMYHPEVFGRNGTEVVEVVK